MNAKMTMKSTMTTLTTALSAVLLCAALFTAGCAKQEPVKAAGAAVAAAPMVEVAAEGTNFEPPVAKSQIPAGAWYCDMGTVHFARTEEGDGKCPRCSMKLHHQ